MMTRRARRLFLARCVMCGYRSMLTVYQNAMKEYKSLENGSTLQDTLAIWVPNIVQNPSRIISAAEFLLEKYAIGV